MRTQTHSSSANGTDSPQVIILVSAALGTASSLAGAVASWWALAGETPAFIFARFETLRAWRSGEMYLGLPLEFWSLAWFVTLIGLAIQPRVRLSRVWQWCLLLSTIWLIAAAGARAWDARLANWTLNTISLAALGLLAGASMRFEQPVTSGSRTSSTVVTLLSLMAVATVGTGGYLMRLRLQEVPTRQATEVNFLRWFHEARIPSTEPSVSTVTVEVFNDYQCPACAITVPRIRAIVDRYSAHIDGEMRLWLRDFPLDSACSPGLAFGPHPAACEAAMMARFCDQVMGSEARAEAISWMYAEGRELTAARIRDYLGERGLGEQFDEARDELLRGVVGDVVSGLRRGVRATPTVFVDGVRLPNHLYLEIALRSLSRPGR